MDKADVAKNRRRISFRSVDRMFSAMFRKMDWTLRGEVLLEKVFAGPARHKGKERDNSNISCGRAFSHVVSDGPQLPPGQWSWNAGPITGWTKG